MDGPRHSCDGSSELASLMKEKGWKYCPGNTLASSYHCQGALNSLIGCKTPFIKEAGCNHMTVSAVCFGTLFGLTFAFSACHQDAIPTSVMSVEMLSSDLLCGEKSKLLLLLTTAHVICSKTSRIVGFRRENVPMLLSSDLAVYHCTNCSQHCSCYSSLAAALRACI